MSAKKRSPQKVGVEERTDAKGRAQYRPHVYDSRAKRKHRGPWTYSLAEARGWRTNALAKIEAGLLCGERNVTVREAADEFITGVRSGAIRNRSGRVYKPSAIRGYDFALTSRVLPALGNRKLAELRLPDVQRWADTLVAEGLAAQTVRNVVNPLRALYAWATPRGWATVNPTIGLRLPTGGQRRERIATEDEAERILAVLDGNERGVWATALYAGLRVGEIAALRVQDIDLDAGTIRVERSYDWPSRTFGEPKSEAGRRTVPIISRLRPTVAAAVAGKPSLALVFGRDHATPFAYRATVKRAARSWEDADVAGIGLHEARHTFASYLIAAGGPQGADDGHGARGREPHAQA